MALFTNEYFLGGVIIALVFGFLIQKFYGLGKFMRLFTGSGSRLKAAQRAATEAANEAEKAKATAMRAEAAEAAKHVSPETSTITTGS